MIQDNELAAPLLSSRSCLREYDGPFPGTVEASRSSYPLKGLARVTSAMRFHLYIIHLYNTVATNSCFAYYYCSIVFISLSVKRDEFLEVAENKIHKTPEKHLKFKISSRFFKSVVHFKIKDEALKHLIRLINHCVETKYTFAQLQN